MTTCLCSQECAKVYVYRFNGAFQSAAPLHLLVNKETITKIELGERIQFKICEEGVYQFGVNMEDNDITFANKRLTIKNGEEYYLKAGLSGGIEFASLKEMDKQKALKDLNKSNKFVGELEEFEIGVRVNKEINPSVTESGHNMEHKFEKVQIIDNIKFELYDVEKAGERVQLNFKITNLSNKDKVLVSNGLSTSFYGENGEFFNAREICLVSNCENYKEIGSETKYFRNNELEGTYRFNHATATLPYQITVNASFVLLNVDKGTSIIPRGTILFASSDIHKNKLAKIFKLTFHDIPLPKTKDVNNPRVKFINGNKLELELAELNNHRLKVKFRFMNTGGEKLVLNIDSGHVYDGDGNKYEFESILTNSTKGEEKISHWSTKYNQIELAPNIESTFILIAEKIDGVPTSIQRAKILFDDFELSWDDIVIE